MLHCNYIPKIKSRSSIIQKRYVSHLAKFVIQYSVFDNLSALGVIRYSLTSIFLFLISFATAQIPDSIPPANDYADSIALYQDANFSISDTSDLLAEIDSTSILEKKKKKLHSPKKAAMLGLVIPGAGHIYNKKYWKAPLIWGAFAGGVYAIQFNTSQHRLMKDAYCAKLVAEEIRDANVNPCPDPSAATVRQAATYQVLTGQNVEDAPTPGVTSRFNSTAIRRFRDSFDKNTQLSWIALIGGHIVLNGVWSYVDGHLKEFDVNEDLSLRFRPTFETIASMNTSFVGASVILEF